MAACPCVCTSRVKSSHQNTDPKAWRTRSLFPTEAPARCSESTDVDPCRAGWGGVGWAATTALKATKAQTASEFQNNPIRLCNCSFCLNESGPTAPCGQWSSLSPRPHVCGLGPVLCHLQVGSSGFLLSQPRYCQVSKQVGTPACVPTAALPLS